jgi:hypothetical protein
MWPILGFQICFCIGNNMSRFLGSVDPGGGGSTKLGAWDLYDAGVRHGWSERERERERERGRTTGLCSHAVKGGSALHQERLLGEVEGR